MKIYQYIIRDCGGQVWTVRSTNLYEANKLAYKDYVELWERNSNSWNKGLDYNGNSMKTFGEFCRQFVTEINGGGYIGDGFDIYTDDFEIEVEA